MLETESRDGRLKAASQGATKPVHLSVVIPAFNEEMGIVQTVTAVNQSSRLVKRDSVGSPPSPVTGVLPRGGKGPFEHPQLPPKFVALLFRVCGLRGDPFARELNVDEPLRVGAAEVQFYSTRKT